jgi:transposase-like protein
MVLQSLRAVLARKRVVNSQRRLKALVQEEFGGEEDYRVSEVRLRRIALDSGLVDIEVICRESETRKSLIKCPVCGQRLNKVKNLTVFGGTVTLGYKCTACPYWTGLRQRIPARYVFTRKKR